MQVLLNVNNAQGRSWPRSLKNRQVFDAVWNALLDLVELWCGWDSKQALLEGWRMRNKFFTSVPFVDRERWQHSGKSMICSLLPSNHFQVDSTPPYSHLLRSKSIHTAPIFHLQHDSISEPFFPFSIFLTFTLFFFLSLILPPTAIIPVSRFSHSSNSIANFCSTWHHPQRPEASKPFSTFPIFSA